MKMTPDRASWVSGVSPLFLDSLLLWDFVFCFFKRVNYHNYPVTSIVWLQGKEKKRKRSTIFCLSAFRHWLLLKTQTGIIRFTFTCSYDRVVQHKAFWSNAPITYRPSKQNQKNNVNDSGDMQRARLDLLMIRPPLGSDAPRPTWTIPMKQRGV